MRAILDCMRVLTLLAGALLIACSRSEPPPLAAKTAPDAARAATPPSASVSAAANAVPSAGPANDERGSAGSSALASGGAVGARAELVPLEPNLEFMNLPVPGFSDAVVSLPSGATGPRPVAIALHGNFDRPEWQCAVWRGVIGVRGFVLCPRGVVRRDVAKSMDRWEYHSTAAVQRELDAAISALGARFEGYVDVAAPVFTGFSLGAIYGSPIVQKAPARFPRVALVEGGQGSWTPASARSFVAKGGQRLFIACGQSACLSQAKGLAVRLEKAGLPTRSGGVEKAGHTYDGAVAAALQAAWPWLVEGDERWR